MTTTIAILQARMSSTRFPGKELAPLAGKPMIIQQLERIKRSELLDGIVVATSIDASDDELADLLQREGYEVYRGSLDDVLDRFIGVIDRYQPDVVVRLTADCPLVSSQVLDLVISTFLNSKNDYVSNTLTPTFPDGLDIEVVSAKVLQEVNRISEDAHEREHVTLGVYRRPKQFAIENVAGERDLSSLRWTVDVPEDLIFVESVYLELYEKNPNFEVDDILELLDRHPNLSRTSQDAPRNAALIGLNTGAMNVKGS